MLSANISDIFIITVTNDYRIFYNISKSEAINLLKNSVLENLGYIYKNIVFLIFFFFTFLFSIYKMVDVIDVYKSLNICTGTLMKNPDMSKFVPYHLKN